MASPAMIYFDHNATTPVRPEVLEAMLPFLKGAFGNPSSAYKLGQEARKALERARAQAAELVGAAPDELVFTACGSESDALALQGGAEQARIQSGGRLSHVIASEIEHEAVLESLKVLRGRGFTTELLPVDGQGLADPEALRRALKPETALVSVMHANNEVGTVQPVAELAAICREKGVLFHTDAVQSTGKIPYSVRELGVDLLSFSGHKLNAPKGIAALYIRRGVTLVPLVTGRHEKGRRGGTENVAGAVGLGVACALAKKEGPAHAQELAALRDRLEAAVLKLDGVRRNGHPAKRLPNTSHFSFKGLDGHALLIALDLEGICVSVGSACSTGSSEPSGVLAAMGLASQEYSGAMRVSLGWGSSAAEVDRFLEVLPPVLAKLRKAQRAFSL